MWGDFFKTREDAKWFVCFCCVALNGAFGLANVLCGYRIEDLADHVGTTSNDINMIFLTRFFGNVLGLLARTVYGNRLKSLRVLILSSTLILASIATLPYCTAQWELYVLFFVFGACYGIFQISSVSVIRELQGANAAIWMSYYLCTFCICGVVLALIQLSDIGFRSEFILVDVIMFGVIVLFTFAVDPYDDPTMSANMQLPASQIEIPHYWVEFCCGSMLALNMGAKETVIYYIESFIDDKNVDCNRTVAYLILVGFLAAGYLVWIRIQRYATNEWIMTWAYVAFAIQLVPLSLICVYPTNATSLQINLAIFGFISPPSINLCFDICYRYTYRSTLSSAILLFGICLGYSLLPYIATLIWDIGVGPNAIFYVSEVYTVLALCFVPAIPYVTYVKSLNPLMQVRYERIPEGVDV